MITLLVWTTWTPMSDVPKRLLNIITHSLCQDKTIAVGNISLIPLEWHHMRVEMSQVTKITTNSREQQRRYQSFALQVLCEGHPLVSSTDYLTGTSVFKSWHHHIQLSLCPYIDGLVQERRNCIANTLELHLSCTSPSIWCLLGRMKTISYAFLELS